MFSNKFCKLLRTRFYRTPPVLVLECLKLCFILLQKKKKETSRTFFGCFSVFYTKIEEYFLTLAWKFIKKSISIFQNFSKQLFLQIHLPGQLTLFFIKLPVSSTLIHFNPMFPYLFPLMFSGGTLSGGIKCDPWTEMGQQHKIWSL